MKQSLEFHNMAEENIPFFGTSRGHSTLNIDSSSNKIPWFPRNIKVRLDNRLV